MHRDHIRRRLKLRQLEILLAVADAGSMAKAATLLAISQPAISRAIADVEQYRDRLKERVANLAATILTI